MTRALILRPGTRYECHGDGTCCTDIHLLGPMSRTEAARVRRLARRLPVDLDKPPVELHDALEELVFVTDHGRCIFLDEQARCLLHAHVGFDDKPDVCRHFPVGAVATPRGTRVTLSHRCPCVTVGESRPLDEARARGILRKGKSNRIAVGGNVGERIRWRARSYVPFERYEQWERVWLDKLDGTREHTESLERVLRLVPGRLPGLSGTTWRRLAKRFWAWAEDESETDGYFCSVRWVAVALGYEPPAKQLPERPWSWTFDRTRRRAPNPSDVRFLYGRWLSDTMWSLVWSRHGVSIYRGMADLGVRYSVASRLARMFQTDGTRADLAAAEAVMIVDVVASSEPWDWIVRKLVEPKAGRFGTPSRPDPLPASRN